MCVRCDASVSSDNTFHIHLRHLAPSETSGLRVEQHNTGLTLHVVVVQAMDVAGECSITMLTRLMETATPKGGFSLKTHLGM